MTADQVELVRFALGGAARLIADMRADAEGVRAGRYTRRAEMARAYIARALLELADPSADPPDWNPKGPPPAPAPIDREPPRD
jgi:hypothetical protein